MSKLIYDAFIPILEKLNLPDMYVIIFGSHTISEKDPRFLSYHKILKELPGLIMSKDINSPLE